MAGNIDTTNYVSVLNNAASIYTKDTKLQQTKERKTTDSKKPKPKSFLDSLLDTGLQNSNSVKDEIDYEKMLAGLTGEARKKAVDDIMADLQDKVYSSGANLADAINAQTINEYKKSVKQFLDFAVKNSLDVRSVSSGGYKMMMKGQGTKKAFVSVKVINEKMDKLTKELLFNQLEKLEILERLDEIKGLLVDLIT